MASDKMRFGLGCALLTPMTGSGAVDQNRLTAHAMSLLSAGCDSVTVFGTTGEGASFGLRDREAALSAFARAGIASEQVVGGVLSTPLEDAAAQARMFLGAGCRGVLLAPPFYFKVVSDDGLFAWFADVFETLGADARDVILYHIPSVTQVPISVDLVGRLRREFPQVILGVKDSSGDWDYTQRLLNAHRDLIILVGDERHLRAAVRLGAQGCISGLANIVAGLMTPLVRNAGAELPANDLVSQLVNEIVKMPVIPALKVLLAHQTGDREWLRSRPPLAPLVEADAKRLIATYDRICVEAARCEP